MRFFDIGIYVILLNLLFTAFNVIPIYIDGDGNEQTLGPQFRDNPILTPERLLANQSCVLSVNGSTSCTQPSALGSPSVANSVFTFGFFTAGLDFVYSLAGVGGFVYSTMNDFGVPTAFSIVVSGGINIIFVLSIIYIITGRQVAP